MKKVLELYIGEDPASLWVKNYYTVYHLFSSQTEVDEYAQKIATPLQAIRFLHKLLDLDNRFGMEINKLEYEDSADCELVIRMRVKSKDRKDYKVLGL